MPLHCLYYNTCNGEKKATLHMCPSLGGSIRARLAVGLLPMIFQRRESVLKCMKAVNYIYIRGDKDEKCVNSLSGVV